MFLTDEKGNFLREKGIHVSDRDYDRFRRIYREKPGVKMYLAYGYRKRHAYDEATMEVEEYKMGEHIGVLLVYELPDSVREKETEAQAFVPQHQTIPSPFSGMHQLFNKICKHRKKHDTVQPHHIAVIAYKKIRQCVHTAKRNCHTFSARIFFPGIPCHGYAAKPCLDQNHRSDSLVYIHEFHKLQY